jgi:hypothetical protein
MEGGGMEKMEEMEEMKENQEKLTFAKAIRTQKKDMSLPEGWIHLTYEKGHCGKVQYTYAKKSSKTLASELLEQEKQDIENSLNYRMTEAILRMEIRREEYRNQDFMDYGYDKYTEEFYYDPVLPDWD